MFVSFVRDQCVDNADVDKGHFFETIVLIEIGELGDMCSLPMPHFNDIRSVDEACCSNYQTNK